MSVETVFAGVTNDVPVSPAMAVPPEDCLYHLNTGLEAPDVEATEQVGTLIPHCVLLVAAGAVGKGVVVTETVAVNGQLFTVAVPVKVVFAETGVDKGLVVPTTFVPSDHE